MARREKTVTAVAADFLRALRTGVLTLGPEVEAEAIANCFAAKRGDLQGISTGGKNVPFGFSGVNDCREIYPVAPAATVFSLLAIGESMTSCIKIESDVRVRDKNSNRATVGIISNFNLLRGSFPLLLSSACLRHYALLILRIVMYPNCRNPQVFPAVWLIQNLLQCSHSSIDITSYRKNISRNVHQCRDGKLWKTTQTRTGWYTLHTHCHPYIFLHF